MEVLRALGAIAAYLAISAVAVVVLTALIDKQSLWSALRYAWIEATEIIWETTHPATGRAFEHLVIDTVHQRACLRNGWTADMIDKIAIPGVPGLLMYQRGYVAAAVTPDQLRRWLPHLRACHWTTVVSEVQECAAWTAALGDLAPLARAAGLDLPEATTLVARGEITDQSLRTLLALTHSTPATS